MNEPLPADTTLRDFVRVDAAQVLAVNASNQPAVGPMDEIKLGQLAAAAFWFAVVEQAGELVGFAILLHEGVDYASPNYRWFAARHARFAYVDRIALMPRARSLGIGGAIYREVIDRSRRQRRPVLCAEVNTLPPNTASLRFHARLGFEEVARQRPYGDDMEVAMLERPI